MRDAREESMEASKCNKNEQSLIDVSEEGVDPAVKEVLSQEMPPG